MTRNQLRVFAAIFKWHRSHHRPCRIADLVKRLDSDPVTVSLALKLTGWRRDRVRITRNKRRQLQTWWIPPNGQPIQRRRRGRPSIAELLYPTKGD